MGADEVDELDEGLLHERLATVFRRYGERLTRDDDLSAADVLARRLSGESQRSIARALGVSERWVRTLQERAAESFWGWARSEFHDDDWARLVPAELANLPAKGLVRWLSRRKRHQLAAVLIRLFAEQDEDRSTRPT